MARWEGVWEKEWRRLQKKERQLAKRRERDTVSYINKTLEGKVPPKLQKTLDIAFSKAFSMVFLKGTTIIEKTYAKEKQKDQYKVNEFAADLRKDRKSLRAFSQRAASENTKSLVLSGIEGIGLGALGIGVPDIPLFIAVLLRNLYQIAVSFGYTYETEGEQVFLLKLIQAALETGEDFKRVNQEINEYIEGKTIAIWERESQTEQTAQKLSQELLYMKFLQGIPVVGIAGGLSDTIYLKKISGYASLKYQRRFLWDHKEKKGLELDF